MLASRSSRPDELTTEGAVGVGVAAAGEWLGARVVFAVGAASVAPLDRRLAGGRPV